MIKPTLAAARQGIIGCGLVCFALVAQGGVDCELNKVFREHVDAASGTTNRVLGKLFTERCISSPIVGGELIFASEGRGGTGLRTIAVKPGKKGTLPALAYEITKSAPLEPTPLAKDGRLYL